MEPKLLKENHSLIVDTPQDVVLPTDHVMIIMKVREVREHEHVDFDGFQYERMNLRD